MTRMKTMISHLGKSVSGLEVGSSKKGEKPKLGKKRRYAVPG